MTKACVLNVIMKIYSLVKGPFRKHYCSVVETCYWGGYPYLVNHLKFHIFCQSAKGAHSDFAIHWKGGLEFLNLWRGGGTQISQNNNYQKSPNGSLQNTCRGAKNMCLYGWVGGKLYSSFANLWMGWFRWSFEQGQIMLMKIENPRGMISE